MKDDNVNWDKLGADLNLSSLVKGFEKETIPTKLIEFAKEWETLCKEENSQVDINVNLSLTGEGAREVQKFLLLYKYLKKRGEMELSQKEFIGQAIIVGCIRHNSFGNELANQAKFAQKMLNHMRENPDKYRKDLEDAIQGNDFFNEFTE